MNCKIQALQSTKVISREQLYKKPKEDRNKNKKSQAKFQVLMQHFLAKWRLIGAALGNSMLDDHQIPV